YSAESCQFCEERVDVLVPDAERQNAGAAAVARQARHAARHARRLEVAHHPRRPPAAEVRRLEPDVPPARHVERAVPEQHAGQLLDAFPVHATAAGVLELQRYLLLGSPDQPDDVLEVAVRHLVARRHGHLRGDAVAVVALLGADVLARVGREDERRGRVGVVGGDDRARAAPPQRGGDRLEHGARLAGVHVAGGGGVLRLDAFDHGRRDGDVEVREPLGLQAQHRLLDGGDQRRQRREGAIAAAHREHRRPGQPAREVADGLQELGDPQAVGDDVVPRHADDEPAAGELRHLHEQQRIILAASLRRIVHGELLQHRRERRVEQLDVVESAAGRGGDEAHALAGAGDAEPPFAGGEISSAGDGVVVDQSLGQCPLDRHGRLNDAIGEDVE
ncbi:Os04g0175450, partial [Oryza sativa Japonica Group]